MMKLIIIIVFFFFVKWFLYIGAKGRLEGTNQFTKQKQDLGSLSKSEIKVSDSKKEASKQSLVGSIILTVILIVIIYIF
ncbi:hypothetical protein [Flavobacterium sp.]|uniref:hypothetical protein n=1 Tax=Flavobacterium sp. TaxID=239 RepID=UPI003F69B384